MIFNWSKVRKEQEEVKEEVIVRDFVKKIAEKIRDGFFECSLIGPYYKFSFKDIKITTLGTSVFLYVLDKIISLNSEEKKLIMIELEIMIDKNIKLETEKLRIQEEIEVNEAIKTVMEYFND